MPPDLLIDSAIAISSPHQSYVMEVHFVLKAPEPGYHWAIKLRGERLRAKQVFLKAPAETILRGGRPHGHMKVSGSLWLLGDGVYEIRPYKETK